MTLLFAAVAVAATDGLRGQLAAAEQADNKPAIVEICQRLVAVSPKDEKSWTTLIDNLLALEETDRAATAVEGFARDNPRASVLDDFRGDVALARKDFAGAEKHWRAYLATKPAKIDVAATWEKLGDLFVDQKRWPEVLAARTKQLEAQNTAANHVARATALLRLHQWDAAYAGMHKANAMDATDEQTKEWLPQFERLQPFLPELKRLDAQIANAPGNYELLLDRARIFTMAERPLLAQSDAQAAFDLQPASMRARIQLAEAFLDNKEPDAAAKLEVSQQLTRVKGHVEERILNELQARDAEIIAHYDVGAALAARAEPLRSLRQYTLALRDAESALQISADNADAQAQAALALDALDRTEEALAHAVRATELDANDSSKWYERGLIEAKRADLAAAIKSQTRSLALRDSYLARLERESYERRIGDVAHADEDLRKLRGANP
ncbi:MAG: hypothetical protein M3R59_03690 [Verrucomicrobiota bacterium]|nr:hypothetical protein [Verrucomicrobiota bacterium]